MDCSVTLEKIKKIYRMLEDDCSRTVYLNRINYYMTKDGSYIKNMAMACVPELLKESGEEQLLYRIRENFPGDEIILYGAGLDGLRSGQFWSDVPEFSAFCDGDEEKQKLKLCGKKVISPTELIEQHENAIVVISTGKYEQEVIQWLLDNNWNHERIFSLRQFTIKYDPEQYFDSKIINYDEQEIFVDAGALNIGTSIELAKRCPSLKKVHAFEPDPQNFNRCLEEKKKLYPIEVEVYPYGLWDCNRELQFSSTGNGRASIEENGEERVSVVALDKVIKEKITFLKMDIEGAELKALIGAKELIKKYKPKLTICLYHKETDLVDIPLFIKELVPEYKLYIRHHSTGTEETVLYAVVEEEKCGFKKL